MDIDLGRGNLGALRAWFAPVGLGVLVVAFAAGSGSVAEIKRAGLHLRWVVLAVLLIGLGVAALHRWRGLRQRPGSGLMRFSVLALAFLGLSFVSTGWSVAPRLTFERAASLAILFAVAGLLAYTVENNEAARRRALAGLAGGAVTVALIGIAMLVLDRSAAVQQAAKTTPWRYRGFTENPNTISILAAVALPIIAWLGLTSPRPRARLTWLASALLLLGSVIAAESRGGLLASAFGIAVVCISQFRSWRQRVVALATIALVLAGGIELRAAVDPGQSPFVSRIPPAPALPPVTKGDHRVHLTIKTHELPGEESEIGHPLFSRSATSVAGSGRVAEWKGVLRQVELRPLLGYGFGTEERVFVDRWYYFEGGTAENSYLGLLLQLGVLGALFLCAIAGLLFVAAVRVIRRTPRDRHGEVAAELGVLVAAFTLMLIQSYIYSVGNVASATAWIAIFLLGTNVLGKDRDASPA